MLTYIEGLFRSAWGGEGDGEEDEQEGKVCEWQVPLILLICWEFVVFCF